LHSELWQPRAGGRRVTASSARTTTTQELATSRLRSRTCSQRAATARGRDERRTRARTAGRPKLRPARIRTVRGRVEPRRQSVRGLCGGHRRSPPPRSQRQSSNGIAGLHGHIGQPHLMPVQSVARPSAYRSQSAFGGESPTGGVSAERELRIRAQSILTRRDLLEPRPPLADLSLTGARVDLDRGLDRQRTTTSTSSLVWVRCPAGTSNLRRLAQRPSSGPSTLSAIGL
jgi:hypothetical protein